MILYGKSIILGTVGASLRRCADLEVLALTSPLPSAQELGVLSPDVILFDLEAAHPDSALSLLETRPHLLLVGINPENDQMFLWSGEQGRVLNTQDLLHVIRVSQEDPPLSADESFFQHLAQFRPAAIPRRQKLLFLPAAVVLIACFVVLLLTDHQNDSQLSGTANGTLPVEVWWAFVAGILVTSLVFGVWNWSRKKR